MLAAVAHDIPLREHSHLDLHSAASPDNLETRLCPGCKNSVVNEQGGVVVAFGQSFFHVDCFKCAKCRNQVTADTNLLLLSDGSPICANCSYSCNICHLPILDEAIMTGDDAYHAHCFKCKVCNKSIEELVFAKTSQGIYCMECHSERMIKMRKHAQKRAERAGGGSGSSRSREQQARNFHRDQERSATDEQARPSMTRSHSNLGASLRSDSPRTPDFRSPAKPINGPYVSDAFGATPPSYSTSPTPRPLPPIQPLRSPSVVIAPPESESPPPHRLYQQHEHLSQPNVPTKSNTLPIPPNSLSFDNQRRSSFDDGLHPIQRSDSQSSEFNDPPTVQGLNVTSKRDKRRSINPGIAFSPFNPLNDSATSSISAQEASLSAPNVNGSPNVSYADAKEQFHSSSSRSPSRADSAQNVKPPESVQQRKKSEDSSIFDSSYYRDADNHDDTIVMASPPTMPIELEKHAENSENRFSNGSSHTHNGRNSGNAHAYSSQRGSATLSPSAANGHYEGDQRRSSSSSNLSVESGTYTEHENEDNLSKSFDGGPPKPPPKDARNSTRSSDTTLNDDYDLSQYDDEMSDDGNEMQAEERTSHSTFIAPALPPIRFSMNTGDFGDLLNGLPSLKSLDTLSKLSKDGQDDVPSTPPPTASSFETVRHDLTPTATEARNSAHSSVFTLPIVPEDYAIGASQTLTVQNGSRPSSRDATSPSPTVAMPIPRRTDSDPDLVLNRLREALAYAKEKGAPHLKIDFAFVQAVLDHVDNRNAEYRQIKEKLDGMNRESKLYMDDMTVAQADYDRELKARREAEAEVTRLRVLLSGQAVRLTALTGDNRRQDVLQQLSKDMHENLSGLEHDLSRLKVQRDVTLAEVEELSSKKSAGSNGDLGPTTLGRSITKRLENIRSQYQKELIPLNEQKEALNREIYELKAVRDTFLEETSVLNARNEELAQLSTLYTRRMDSQTDSQGQNKFVNDSSDTLPSRGQSSLMPPKLSTSASQSSMYDETHPGMIRSLSSRSDNSNSDMLTPMKPATNNKFKWPGSSTKVQRDYLASPAPPTAPEVPPKGKAHIEHNFQQLSILRFTKCDHCGDKMWGSQLRCSACNTSIHVRCIANVQISCVQTHNNHSRDESAPLPMGPPMFGRNLAEQVELDSKEEERQIPVVVDKCIEAVEERALDYEGIYRKTGGAGQTKAITQLFERGDYTSFDLRDSDRFNDISSVTSVLKTYFRSLPIPLLTYDLHDQFMSAIMIRDPSVKQQSLVDLIDKLPNEYYFTLRRLMLHLHRVSERSDRNLMNGRNLGVVFGPTLLRSRDPGAEFSDMAGKALFVEWLVENAPLVFNSSE